jgi:Methylmalonyl-CoA mutase
LKAFRRQRDNSAATRALADLKSAAEGTENLVPRIVSAVKARSTLGEIANAMREVFGEHGRALKSAAGADHPAPRAYPKPAAVAVLAQGTRGS